MDANLGGQQTTEPLEVIQYQNNRKKVNLSKILIVYIGIILLLVVLNYFNVLSFSWLPRMSSQEPLSTGPIQTTPTKTALSIQEAEEIFSKFISDNFNSSVYNSLPLIHLKEDSKEQNTFSASWESQIGSMNVTLAISPNTKNISYLYFSSTYDAVNNISLTPIIAKEISTLFFSTRQQGEWTCKSLYESTYCEIFWEENSSIKRGVSISGPILSADNQSVFIVSLCEYNKENNLLYSRKSCITEFADSGIK